MKTYKILFVALALCIGFVGHAEEPTQSPFEGISLNGYIFDVGEPVILTIDHPDAAEVWVYYSNSTTPAIVTADMVIPLTYDSLGVTTVKVWVKDIEGREIAREYLCFTVFDSSTIPADGNPASEKQFINGAGKLWLGTNNWRFGFSSKYNVGDIIPTGRLSLVRTDGVPLKFAEKEQNYLILTPNLFGGHDFALACEGELNGEVGYSCLFYFGQTKTYTQRTDKYNDAMSVFILITAPDGSEVVSSAGSLTGGDFRVH